MSTPNQRQSAANNGLVLFSSFLAVYSSLAASLYFSTLFSSFLDWFLTFVTHMPQLYCVKSRYSLFFPLSISPPFLFVRLLPIVAIVLVYVRSGLFRHATYTFAIAAHITSHQIKSNQIISNHIKSIHVA
jgi:hypothetical protein